MKLISHVLAVNGNIGYASELEKNGLFEVNLETGDSKYICLFPDEEITRGRIHSSAVCIDERVFFVPEAGNNISIYHINTGDVETIKIPIFAKNHTYNPRFKFAKSIVYGHCLWLIPATYPGILKFDLQTNEIAIIDNCFINTEYMFRRAICIKKNMIFAASGINNRVLIFDVDLETGKIVSIGNNNNGIMDMCMSGDDFIMAPRKKGAVIKWNYSTNVIEEYNDYPATFKFGEIVFERVYEYGSQFFIAPGHASNGVRLTDVGLSIEDEVCWKTDNESKVGFMFEANNRLYFREQFLNQSNRFYFVDRNNNEMSPCDFQIVNPTERKSAFVHAATEKHEVIKESKTFGLQDFIKSI